MSSQTFRSIEKHQKHYLHEGIIKEVVAETSLVRTRGVRRSIFAKHASPCVRSVWQSPLAQRTRKAVFDSF